MNKPNKYKQILFALGIIIILTLFYFALSMKKGIFIGIAFIFSTIFSVFVLEED